MRLQIAELLEAVQRRRDERNEHDAGEHDERGEERDARQRRADGGPKARAPPPRRLAGSQSASQSSRMKSRLVAEGEGHADDEQHDADRRAEADAHPGDAEIIEVGDHRVGGLERAAAGQRHDDVEELAARR